VDHGSLFHAPPPYNFRAVGEAIAALRPALMAELERLRAEEPAIT
jgi:hypothetical protein